MIDNSDIMVSICCITYNHERYIRDAIEGFLMQKTNFKYEILIHDDASTDDTANIIREYEKRFPDLIKPIYQKENQYSKGASVVIEYVLKKVKGKYIALCEGDDYWTNPYKLQKQVDFLEKNQKFSMCFHNVKVVDENKNILLNHVQFNPKEKKVNYLEDIIPANYIPTCSVVFRNHLINYSDFEVLSNGLYFTDFVIHILNAKEGPIYYFNEDMAVYRVTEKGASKSTDSRRSLEDKLKFYKRLEKYFDDKNIRRIINKATIKYKIDLYIEYVRKNELEKAEELFQDIKNIKRTDIFIKAGLKRSLKFFLIKHFPNQYENIRQNYRKLKGIEE